MKKQNYFFAVILAAAAIDQLTKFFASKMAASVPVINNFFHLTFVKNTGIIFGILPGSNGLLVWLYVIVIGLLVFCFDKFPKDRFSRIMLALVFAGVIGNFIDRIAFGYVIDFIDFKIWPVFNIADLFLNIGIIGILVKSLMDGKKR